MHLTSGLGLSLLLILLLNSWIAWRYSKLEIGPDEALWLFWPMLRAVPMRDFNGGMVVTHLLLKGLSFIVGRDVARLKFSYHVFIGLLCAGATLITGQLATGLVATALLQSGWLLAFQSWYDALSGAFLLLMVLAGRHAGPLPALLLAGLAVGTNIKAGPPAVVFFLLAGWPGWLVGAGLAGLAGLGLWALGDRFVRPLFFEEFWVDMVVVPWRLIKLRADHSPWMSGGSLNPAMPFVVMAIPLLVLFADGQLVAIAGAALVTTVAGRVLRTNYWLMILPVLAAGAVPLWVAIWLLAVEFASFMGYFSNAWRVSYPTILAWLEEAKIMGEFVREHVPEDVDLFVNSAMTQIYIYARRPLKYGMIDPYEIGGAIPDKINVQERLLLSDPPRLVVNGPMPLMGFKGYHPFVNGEDFQIVQASE